MVTKRNRTTGKTTRKFVEVKSGSAKLSRLQRAKKRAYGRRYVTKRA